MTAWWTSAVACRCTSTAWVRGPPRWSSRTGTVPTARAGAWCSAISAGSRARVRTTAWATASARARRPSTTRFARWRTCSSRERPFLPRTCSSRTRWGDQRAPVPGRASGRRGRHGARRRGDRDVVAGAHRDPHVARLPRRAARSGARRPPPLDRGSSRVRSATCHSWSSRREGRSAASARTLSSRSCTRGDSRRGSSPVGRRPHRIGIEVRVRRGCGIVAWSTEAGGRSPSSESWPGGPP
jgi:LSD1 subclass zinc finger protein